jgi:general nucleoside transport system permease protein
VICSIIILAIGENPIRVYGVILQGGFGSGYSLMNTLTRSIPIILTGLGAVIAWRAGYINIGGEGQMILGGFVTTICALYLPVGGPIGMVISLIAGMIAGGAVALFSAWLEKRLAVMILITTLLFNYIIDYIVYYFVAFPFKDPSNGGIAIKTYVIDKSLWLSKIGNVRGSLFHSGFIIALAVFAVVLFIIKKTAFGYESKMTGLNPSFARYGGVRSAKIMFLTMFLSGAIAALGGGVEVLGVKHLYMQNMFTSTAFAWTGLMAALIGGLNPVGTVISSIVLAGIQTGGTMLEHKTSIPLDISFVIQSVITLMISAKIYDRLLHIMKAKRAFKSVKRGHTHGV